MEDLKKKLIYLNNEEVDELINIGVISLERLQNLEAYYPFTLRYSASKQSDLIRRIGLSLEDSSGVILKQSSETIIEPSRDNRYMQINEELYWCSARRSIPMKKVVKAIHNYLNENGAVLFGNLYYHLRMHFKIRSFNRQRLICVLRDLEALDNKFVKPFDLPTMFDESEVTELFLKDLYDKVLQIKDGMGLEYANDLILNATSFLDFSRDAYNYKRTNNLINLSFLKNLNDIVSNNSNFDEFKALINTRAEDNRALRYLEPILESDLVTSLIDFYPEKNDELLSFINAFDQSVVFDYSKFSQVSVLNEYLLWIHKSKVLKSRKSLEEYISNEKNKRNILVYRERSAVGNRSKTLEDIGFEIGLTRERVRQIANKVGNRILTSVKMVDEKLLFSDGSGTVSINLIKKLFPNYVKEVLFAFINNENYYLSKSGLELFHTSKSDRFSTPFLRNEYDRLTKEEFDIILNREVVVDIEKDLLNAYYSHLSKNYYRIGDFFVHKRLNKYRLLVFLVDQNFEDGIKLTDDSQMNELLQAYEEIRGVNDFKDVSSRALVARLSDLLELVGKGTYTSRRNLGELSTFTKSEIHKLAQKILPRPVYYDYIFKHLDNNLVQLDGIRDYHHLHGLMKVFMEEDYVYHKDYFAHNRIESHTAELEDELLGLNRIITKKDFDAVTTSKSKTSFQNLYQSGKWIYLGNKRYLSKIILKELETPLNKLIELVLQLLKVNDVYHLSLLYPYLSEEVPILVEQYGIDNSTALSNLLSYLNKGHWKQLSNYVFKNELFISNRFDVVKHLIRDLDKVSIQEVYFRISQIGDKVLNGQHLIDGLFPLYSRISQNELMKSSNIRLSDMELREIDSMIGSLLITRKAIYLSKLKSFDKFPSINFEWNEHLLAYVIKLNFSHYKALYTENNYVTTSYLITRSSLGIDTFEEYKKLGETNE